ncbi:MAG: class I SAM-dependent methyltransferase [Desulfohalobiaceae bacterium]|nr:class I SAM-dependent methyltransferase [Desulfohalobiaceae bacterium]
MIEDREQVTRQRIEKLVDLRGKQVLEIGCGQGRVTSMLIQDAGRIVAIDPDRSRIARARESLPGADFRVGTAQNLDFEDNSFDLVLFSLSLHHQESNTALEEAGRVLRQDGRALVLEPALDGEVQTLATLFEDEAPALIYARQAIKGCSLGVEDTEVFYTEWVFEDLKELYNYHFEYYNQEFAPEIARRIDEFLGEKVDSRPLILKDKLIIYSLKPKT